MTLSKVQRSSWLLSGLCVIAGCGGGESESSTAVAPTPATTSADNASATTPKSAAATPVSADASQAIVRPATLSKTPGTETAPADSAGNDQKTRGKSSTETAATPVDDASSTLREIQKLRVSPVPNDLEQARKVRRERNERIVDMATRVIRLTMTDESKKPQFQAAVSQLLEARFQNALAGDDADIDIFCSDVQALSERDPKSAAAAEGVYYMARFAHTRAGLVGSAQPVWFETLSRWAREFADRFPEQQNRAASLLFGAARSCELHADAVQDPELRPRLLTESRLCYVALSEKFSSSDQGQEAAASLRRLSVVGQKLTQFTGPTIDGGQISADDFRGKATLIYFWDSENENFAEQFLPAINAAIASATSDKLRIVGVAMDEEEGRLNRFLDMHQIPGQQIFFPDAEQRSWNSPIVTWWGLARCPSIWLVDGTGKVVSTSVSPKNLALEVRKLVR